MNTLSNYVNYSDDNGDDKTTVENDNFFSQLETLDVLDRPARDGYGIGRTRGAPLKHTRERSRPVRI